MSGGEPGILKVRTKMAKIERALLSLTDKTGAVEFARGLRELDVDLISTGGTAKLLKDAGIPVFDVGKLPGLVSGLRSRYSRE